MGDKRRRANRQHENAQKASMPEKEKLTQELLRRAWRAGIRFVTQSWDGRQFQVVQTTHHAPELLTTYKLEDAKTFEVVNEVDADAQWTGTLEEAGIIISADNRPDIEEGTLEILQHAGIRAVVDQAGRQWGIVEIPPARKMVLVDMRGEEYSDALQASMAERNDLAVKIGELKTELETCRERKETANTRAQELAVQGNERLNRLHIQADEIKRLTARCNSRTDQLAGMTGQRDGLTETVAVLRARLDEANKVVGWMTKERDKANADWNDMSKRLALVSSDLEMWRERMMKAQTSYQMVSSQRDKIQAERDELKSLCQYHLAFRQKAQMERQKARAELVELDGLAEHLALTRKQLAEAEAELDLHKAGFKTNPVPPPSGTDQQQMIWTATELMRQASLVTSFAAQLVNVAAKKL